MSFKCQAWANKQKVKTIYEKMVLLQLADRTNGDTGLCIPKMKRLAEDSVMSEDSARRAIKSLEELGLVEVIPRFYEGVQISNQYRLIMGSEEGVVAIGEGGEDLATATPPRTIARVAPANSESKEPVIEPGIEPKELLRTESPKPTSEDFTLSQDVAKAPPRKGGRPPQVPIPLPDDFKPSPEHIKVALANGVDVDACLKTLRAWAIGKVRADWNRQFAVFLTPDKWGRNLAKKTEERKFTPIPKYDAEGNVIVSP